MLRVQFASIVAALAISTAASAAESLPAPVAASLSQHGHSQDAYSVFVKEIGGDTVLSYRAEVARNPASSIKVLTTLAALETLGPAYTWKTEAYAAGQLHGGILDGDLVLVGSGDPFLVAEEYWKFVQSIRRSGLTLIDGELVIDGSYFASEPKDPAEFDGHPYRAYNALPHALLVNFLAIDFIFEPDGSARPRVVTAPGLDNLEIVNELRITDSGCQLRSLRMLVDEKEQGSRVRFSGPYPRRCGQRSFARTVMNAEAMAGGMFQRMWRESGGAFDGTIRAGVLPADVQRLAVHESRPLAEIIRSINKYSNNIMTRQLLLTLGAETFGEPGTTAKGRNAVSAWLESTGVNAPELVLDNGAGLSRDARISAENLAALLEYAYERPYAPEFLSSLPLVGLDGTLKRRFRNAGLADGSARMKTGRIDHVAAVAGYLRSRSGRQFVVVSLNSNRGAHQGSGTRVEEALLRWAYSL